MQSDQGQSRPPRYGLSHYAIPTVIIAFCALAFWLSTQFDRVPPILKRGIQPSDFPQLIIGLIILLSLSLFIWDKDEAPDPLSGVVWKTIALLVGFIAIAQIDLMIGIGLFCGCLTILWGERRPVMIALVAILVPLGAFFLFDLVFEVRFPRGLLTNFWYG